MKKFKKAYILPAVLFVIGFGIVMYPTVSDLVYQIIVGFQAEKYDEDIEKNKKLDELYKELKKRNEELFENKQDTLVDPWSYEQSGIDLSEYGLEDNIVGFIKLKKMDIELPILLGANKENMRKGAGHLTETSYPIGGNNTNCVIAAHRGAIHSKMFKEIELLEPGDEVIIKNFKEELKYKVVETKIIKPTEVDKLLIQENRDLVTLITCHPLRHNYQRYVVFCERQLNVEKDKLKIE